jgi:hypothetical protein
VPTALCHIVDSIVINIHTSMNFIIITTTTANPLMCPSPLHVSVAVHVVVQHQVVLLLDVPVPLLRPHHNAVGDPGVEDM